MRKDCGLKQRKCIPLPFWKSEMWNQRVGRTMFLLEKDHVPSCPSLFRVMCPCHAYLKRPPSFLAPQPLPHLQRAIFQLLFHCQMTFSVIAFLAFLLGGPLLITSACPDSPDTLYHKILNLITSGRWSLLSLPQPFSLIPFSPSLKYSLVYATSLALGSAGDCGSWFPKGVHWGFISRKQYNILKTQLSTPKTQTGLNKMWLAFSFLEGCKTRNTFGIVLLMHKRPIVTQGDSFFCSLTCRGHGRLASTWAIMCGGHLDIGCKLRTWYYTKSILNTVPRTKTIIILVILLKSFESFRKEMQSPLS